MRFYVGVTDKEWYGFLAERKPDEVNFWQPGGTTRFRAIEPGAPFLFKLHSPLNFIVGGGFFVGHSLLPMSIAWEAFASKNGTDDEQVFYSKIHRYRQRKGTEDVDPTIGCIVLTSPFFFKRKDWLPVPEDWKGSIVQGKSYDTATAIGRNLWEQVEVLSRDATAGNVPLPAMAAEDAPRYGAWSRVRPRLGQGAFRILVTEAYQRRCAMTGERTLPVLEAAHIQPYAKQGPHLVSNGLLLRSDLHHLFDRGLITVTPEHTIKVSDRIREQWQDGRVYYELHGKKLAVLPASTQEQPNPLYLKWHNEKVYIG